MYAHIAVLCFGLRNVSVAVVLNICQFTISVVEVAGLFSLHTEHHPSLYLAF
jgi:hypothetical protein